MTDPFNIKPPKSMVEAAKFFIKHYVDFDADLDTIEKQADIALFEWKAWAGKAFNEAMDQLEPKHLQEQQITFNKKRFQKLGGILKEQSDDYDDY